MSDLVVIVPSRGRPEAAVELAESFAETCSLNTQPVFAIDVDDPASDGYYEVSRRGLGFVVVSATTSMVDALNARATGFAGLGPELAPFALGFQGDDHRPRSRGWDKRYLDELRSLGSGFVYGDDLLQGPNLPTQVAMTSDIVRALGWMAPPFLRHMYVDNSWKVLGEAIGRIRYLPDVVVEHMHPVAGKSEWTEGHIRVNDGAIYAADHAAFEAWRNGAAFVDAVGKLRGLL